MFKILTIGFAIIAVNVMLQGLSTTYWVRGVRKRIARWEGKLTRWRIFKMLILLSLALTLLHTLHAMIWAFCIHMIPEVQADFNSFIDIFYYSIVTFTTLGYGDLTLSSDWKLLSGIEAINGIMLIGWSTALMYSLIENIFKTIRKNNG